MYVWVERAWCGTGSRATVLNSGWDPPWQGGQRGQPRAGSPLSSGPHQLEVPPRPPAVTPTPAPKAEPAIIPATRNEPIGLKASDFLPVSGVQPEGRVEAPGARMELDHQHLS